MECSRSKTLVDNEALKPVGRSRRKIFAAGVCALVSTLYVSSFLLLRQSNRFSFPLPTDEKGLLKPISCTQRAYYFSAHPFTNRCLYVLYWPIHAVVLHGDSEGALWKSHSSPEDCKRDIYVENVYPMIFE